MEKTCHHHPSVAHEPECKMAPVTMTQTRAPKSHFGLMLHQERPLTLQTGFPEICSPSSCLFDHGPCGQVRFRGNDSVNELDDHGEAFGWRDVLRAEMSVESQVVFTISVRS